MRGLGRLTTALRHCARRYLSATSSSPGAASPETLATATTGTRAADSAAEPAAPGPATAFSEEEVMLRDVVARFSREALAPHVRSMDQRAELDPEVLRSLFEQGLMGIETPEEHGGGGMTFTQACIVIEELAKVDPAVSVIVDIHNTLLNTAVRKHGTAEQRERWLPELAQEKLGAFALSEAGSGSDAFALKTRAVEDGGDFTLSGSKMWISNAKEGGWMLVFANARPEDGHRGITAFVVEDVEAAKKKGELVIAKKEDKLGIRASSCCEVVLDGCRVPRAHVLGEVGRGYRIAIESLNEGRVGIGAQMVGLAQGALDATVPYLHERRQFGRPIADFQGVQFQVAQAAAELEAARTVVYNAARLNDAGRSVMYEAACAKLLAAQVACDVSRKCVEWAGGVGFTKEFAMEKFYRDAVIGKIYEGTENIQLSTIAKQAMAPYKQQR